MGTWIKRIVMILLLAVFLGSGGVVISILHQYRVSQKLYDKTAERFVTVRTAEPTGGEASPAASVISEGVSQEAAAASTLSPAPGADSPDTPAGPARSPELAPFQVDFEALRAEGPDVVGWIYCEGTIINYPVVQGEDDDYYLHRSYDGSYNFPGSIFVEALNAPGFADYNTIIYGHNMKDNSMFSVLEDWQSQSFYDQHPVMWLLTPEQDYKIELISGYTTSAGSEAYQLFYGPGADLDVYLHNAMAKSDFQAAAEPEAGARYVMLSTCAYVFSNARYVLHGMLRPVSSAGGVPLSQRGNESTDGW